MEAGTFHTYIADFEVAKVLAQGTLSTSRTNSSSVGTPGFQPKEQLRAGKITESADVYAFGCVFIELFGHKKIWEGLSAIQIMFKVAMEEAIPDCSHLPPSVVPICNKCLQDQEIRVSATTVLYLLLSL